MYFSDAVTSNIDDTEALVMKGYVPTTLEQGYQTATIDLENSTVEYNHNASSIGSASHVKSEGEDSPDMDKRYTSVTITRAISKQSDVGGFVITNPAAEVGFHMFSSKRKLLWYGYSL